MSVVLSHLSLTYTGRASSSRPRRPFAGFGRQVSALFLAPRALFGPPVDAAWASEDDYTRFCR
jgi:hypothetical protein